MLQGRGDDSSISMLILVLALERPDADRGDTSSTWMVGPESDGLMVSCSSSDFESLESEDFRSFFTFKRRSDPSAEGGSFLFPRDDPAMLRMRVRSIMLQQLMALHVAHKSSRSPGLEHV